MKFNFAVYPFVVTISLIFSGSLYAEEGQIYFPTRNSYMSDEFRQQEQQRYEQVIRRTSSVITLLGAEMALNQGNIEEAMDMYLSVLRDTQDPEVAERAMDLAISERAYDVAEFVYRQWAKMGNADSVAAQRLRWMQALINGDVDTVFAELSSVLEKSNENQRRRLFLQLSQMSLIHPQLLNQGADVVHQAVKPYHAMPESVIADIFFSRNNEKRAVSALNRLAKLDTEISPITLLTLNFIAQHQPELLNRFFEQNGLRLSANWLELQMDSLIRAQRYEEANQVLKQALQALEQNPNDRPSASLYIQAAILSKYTNNDMGVVLDYLEKAYQIGTEEQQSRAALMAGTYLIEMGDYRQAQQWIERISTSEFMFDKLLLLANLSMYEKNWIQARYYLDQLDRLPEKQGRIFSGDMAQELNINLIANTLSPAQAVAELSQMLRQLEKQDSAQQSNLITQILFQRGLLYADKLHQPEKAVADFRRLLALNPGNAIAQNALGYTMLALGDTHLEEAFQLIQQAYEQKPDNIAINDSLGWAYYKKGDFQAALKYLLFAYQQEPLGEIAAHLGEVYWQLEQYEQAKQIWHQGWLNNPEDSVLQETLKRYHIQFNH